MVRNLYAFKICFVCYPDNLLTHSLRSYVSRKFETDYKSTTGVDYSSKRLKVDTININLHVCDISTDPVFKPNYPNFFRSASAAVFGFSKSNHSFIKDAIDLYHEFRQYRPEATAQVAFIGLSDESEVVTLAEGQFHAQELGVDYFEMAATDLETLDNIMKFLLRKVIALKTS